jgi:hypothetical protein
VLGLDRATLPCGVAAIALLNRDQSEKPIALRLKPKTALGDSRTKLWPTPEEVFASTKLITAAKARAMILAFDQTAGSPNGDAP